MNSDDTSWPTLVNNTSDESINKQIDEKINKRHCKRCHQLASKCICSLGPKLRGK
jgi:hypothetical protein